MRLEVHRAGLLTTVQDLGRPGMGRLGVSPAGAMDPLALRAANRLLGNAPGAAALEVTGAGLELEVVEGGLFALAGADLGASLSGRRLAGWRAHAARAGDVLAFVARHAGARAYLALPGGIDAPRVLGSASMDLQSGLGGGPLRRGELLVAQDAAGGTGGDASLLARWYVPAGRLRVVLASAASLPPQAEQVLLAGAYRVSPRSSRMGYRLEGPPLPGGLPGDATSDAIAPGSVQVAPDGQPILLMADRQTVGGYAVVAHLVRADVARAAQLWPGDPVAFESITRDAAVAFARAQEADLASVRAVAP